MATRTKPAAPDSHEVLYTAVDTLVERVRQIPAAERRELTELIQQITSATTAEEAEGIRAAMMEILKP